MHNKNKSNNKIKPYGTVTIIITKKNNFFLSNVTSLLFKTDFKTRNKNEFAIKKQDQLQDGIINNLNNLFRTIIIIT